MRFEKVYTHQKTAYLAMLALMFFTLSYVATLPPPPTRKWVRHRRTKADPYIMGILGTIATIMFLFYKRKLFIGINKHGVCIWQPANQYIFIPWSALTLISRDVRRPRLWPWPWWLYLVPWKLKIHSRDYNRSHHSIHFLCKYAFKIKVKHTSTYDSTTLIIKDFKRTKANPSLRFEYKNQWPLKWKIELDQWKRWYAKYPKKEYKSIEDFNSD